MAEYFFDLSENERREALEQVRIQTGRPSHLLEKDIWVVWTLCTLFESSLGSDLTFKGGTSLSKAYKIIDRFSEDVDLTYDVRKLIADMIDDAGDFPPSRSQAAKWTKTVRHRLPGWIAENVKPIIEGALARDRLDAKVEIGGEASDKLLLCYPALMQGMGYVSPVVTLEFGARSTGEPHQVMAVVCDMDEQLSDISFPIASPLVMTVARTFWEKATAAHVYSAGGRIRGERYSRHWHDLATIARSRYFADAINDRKVALAVARHKSFFFVEKDADGLAVDYFAAAEGCLRIVPEGQAREALAADYSAMLDDGVMMGNAVSFYQLMQACLEVEAKVNAAAVYKQPMPVRDDDFGVRDDAPSYATAITRAATDSERPSGTCCLRLLADDVSRSIPPRLQSCGSQPRRRRFPRRPPGFSSDRLERILCAG